MSLFKQWEDLMQNQTDETFEEFWDKYSSTETKLYKVLLSDSKKKMEGTFSELVEKHQVDPIIFMGFLDGIQTSLKEGFNLDKITEESEICLEPELEKLFYNMLVAEADYLFTLPEWDNILTDEKKKEIVAAFKRSKTVVKEKEPGRNDPCPCGSGKKYKKCCGIK